MIVSLDLIWDISILFALIAVTLIIYSEFVSPYYGKANMRFNRKRLNQTAFVAFSVFIALMSIRVLTIILN